MMDKLLNDTIHKELDLIQACINRMASNSFLIKGWMVTLIAAIVALLADKVSINVITIIAIAIVLSFWYLDGFFLKTERLFRLKYEWVIDQRPKGNTQYLYDLQPYNSNMWLDPQKGKKNIAQIMFTRTLIPFYAIPLVISVGAIIWSLFCASPAPVPTP
jgi:hypothetical protein